MSASDQTHALFVGGLLETTAAPELTKYFSQYGEVREVNLIIDWVTGKSKRCAIVICKDYNTFQNVLSAKPHYLEGKHMRVDVADQNRKGTKIVRTTKIFLGHIQPDIVQHDLFDFFEKYGDIKHLKIIKNTEVETNSYGYLEFRKVSDAQNLLKERHNVVIKGHKIFCQPFKAKTVQEGQFLKMISNFNSEKLEHCLKIYFQMQVGSMSKNEQREFFSSFGQFLYSDDNKMKQNNNRQGFSMQNNNSYNHNRFSFGANHQQPQSYEPYPQSTGNLHNPGNWSQHSGYAHSQGGNYWQANQRMPMGANGFNFQRGPGFNFNQMNQLNFSSNFLPQNGMQNCQQPQRNYNNCHYPQANYQFPPGVGQENTFPYQNGPICGPQSCGNRPNFNRSMNPTFNQNGPNIFNFDKGMNPHRKTQSMPSHTPPIENQKTWNHFNWNNGGKKKEENKIKQRQLFLFDQLDSKSSENKDQFFQSLAATTASQHSSDDSDGSKTPEKGFDLLLWLKKTSKKNSESSKQIKEEMYEDELLREASTVFSSSKVLF